MSTPWHQGFGNDPFEPQDPAADENGACDRSGSDMSGNPENVVVFTGNQTNGSLGLSLVLVVLGLIAHIIINRMVD